jgi:hypothetical protein
MPTWREDQEAAKSKKSFTQATLVFGSLQLAGYWAYNRKHWVLRLVERKSGTLRYVTRLVPEKYSIENDTKVQMIHFDLWSVERHPQGSII